ncbi:MAG: ABC transporter ATP-binding protein [Planctomycetota bacterium]
MALENERPIKTEPTGQEPAATLLVEGVTFGYGPPGSEPALSEVTATLRTGRVTAILGPNACGKSTLLRVMLGQLKAWSGGVTLDGEPVALLVGKPLARRVSYVPQRGGASFAFTVRQTVAMGRFAFDDEKYVDEALERCGLADLAGRAFNELSGGQQQRVLIARAWAQSQIPEFDARKRFDHSGGGGGATANTILADEPASALDLRHAHEAMGLFRSMAEEGMAVAVVLHGLELATRWADEVWLMDKGRIVAAGPAEEVLRPEVLSPVYGLELESLDHGGRSVLVAKAPTADADAGKLS